MTTLYAATASLEASTPAPVLAGLVRPKFRFSELLQSRRERMLCGAAIILGSLAIVAAIVGIVLVV
jgi:hypothetical protein